jgi:hypothetical protein
MKENKTYVIQAMLAVLVIFAVMLTPWLYWQSKIAKDTLQQNLRVERKIDTLMVNHIILKKKVSIDSAAKVRIERKVDSLIKK